MTLLRTVLVLLALLPACDGERTSPAARAPAPSPTVATTPPAATPAAPSAPPPATAHAVLNAGASTRGSLWDLGLTLEDAAGQARALASFAGHPTIIAMFYARCSYACPTLIADVQSIESALPPAVRSQVRVLLVTFDSAGDDPKTLSELATRHDVDTTRWTFARAADDDRTRELAGALGVKYRRLPDGNYNHSTLITLLNSAGIPLARIDGLRQDATAFRAVVETAVTLP